MDLLLNQEILWWQIALLASLVKWNVTGTFSAFVHLIVVEESPLTGSQNVELTCPAWPLPA